MTNCSCRLISSSLSLFSRVAICLTVSPVISGLRWCLQALKYRFRLNSDPDFINAFCIICAVSVRIYRIEI